jgi:hypothetical protein
MVASSTLVHLALLAYVVNKSNVLIGTAALLHLVADSSFSSGLPIIGPNAAGDMDAIGQFSDARILDTLDLASLESTVYYPLPADQSDDRLPYQRNRAPRNH